MKFVQMSKWYNPNYLVDEEKSNTYCIDEIYVFKDGEIVTKNHSSWFGSNNDGQMTEIDGEFVKKRKIDLNSKVAFIVKSACNIETRYDLYLPADSLDLSAPTYKKGYDNKYIEKTIKSNKYSYMVFTTREYFESNTTELHKAVMEIADNISKSAMLEKIDEVDTLIEKLIESKNALKAELTRLKNVVIDEKTGKIL